jgi:predicted O-methyltransferase YrrM
MNKLEKLKLLFSKPIQIIKKGLLTFEEEQFKKNIEIKYNKSKLPTVDLLDLFPNFEVEINNYSFLNGTSLPTDIALLKLLAKETPNCAYLEIGSWRGESIINVANVTDDVTSFTLSEKEMRAFNFPENFIKNNGIYYPKNNNFKKILHNSQTYDFSKIDKKFDLIFIDGDHSNLGVLNDTINVYKHLLKDENSIIVWHDYSYNTENVRYSVLKAILDGIPEEDHSKLYHVSNTMCAIYTNKNLKAKNRQVLEVPNKHFTLKIKSFKFE